MRALILSGGGALGAFQVGAEKYLREKAGYRWDVIYGISVGALNGAMMAAGEYDCLYKIWEKEVSNLRVLGWPIGWLRLLSLYRQRPIQRLLRRALGDRPEFKTKLRVGTVNLLTGKYHLFKSEVNKENILDAVIASAAMPVIRPPAKVANDRWMVDGGIRNTSPIGEVLKENPNEVVIINCLPREPGGFRKRPWTLIGIAIRSFDVLINEILLEDLKEFEWLNEFVRQAKAQGIVLLHPKHKRPLRDVPSITIEPDEPLGDSMDYSTKQAERLLSEGCAKAEQAVKQRAS